MTRKILYSPGFGAGWTTWNNGTNEELRFMLEYEPFITQLEQGKEITPQLEKQFEQDFLSVFPKSDPPYMGGVEQLTVAEVSGRVRIHDYDGNESYEEEGEYSEWL